MSQFNYYIIESNEFDLRYIGMTSNNVMWRFYTHKYNIKDPKKKHFKLYSKINEIGLNKFNFDVLEIRFFDTKREALDYEKILIKEYNGNLNVY